MVKEVSIFSRNFLEGLVFVSLSVNFFLPSCLLNLYSCIVNYGRIINTVNQLFFFYFIHVNLVLSTPQLNFHNNRSGL